MNNPGATRGFVETACRQAEGEFCPKECYQPKTASRGPLDLNQKTRRRKALCPSRGLLGTTSAVLRPQKTYPIPIEHGPAQFNAFYPQCYGLDIASFHKN
jgi:hypothetical protein